LFDLTGNAGKRNAYSADMVSCSSNQNQCILAIDDEETFLSFLEEALECFGYRVFTASSPQEALKFYEERWREIDVVLLDFWLPPLTGTFVFDELQRLNPDVRVVLLTGCHEPVAAKMFQKGLRGYLKKPFKLPDLAQKVRDAINVPVVPAATSTNVCDVS
jgi:DNA-binding NtrC family response regulator